MVRGRRTITATAPFATAVIPDAAPLLRFARTEVQVESVSLSADGTSTVLTCTSPPRDAVYSRQSDALCTPDRGLSGAYCLLCMILYMHHISLNNF